MRTMNKIVALSLVLAMAFSMMASAASFKDQATINADLMDEINLLVALGVYSENGTGAGNFEPNATITRAQAAKIVYVLKNKGVDNGATSWTGLNIFSDVEEGAWYEGYVNYCASTGIIAGVGDNKFAPNDTLTGVQLAKMLLVVIGYKADVEGYTGAKWDANILADAEAAGFFVDYELSVKGIVTREWAAKMIVNAINATKVRYADGELVEMYNGNTPITFKAQDLGLNEKVDLLVATPNVKLVKSGSAANNENGKNKLSAIGTIANPVEFVYDANPELLGSMVTVLFKGNTLDENAKVYGVTANENNIITDTAIDAVKYDAKNFEDSVYYYEDYIYAKAMNAEETKAFFEANDGRAIKMIDRNNNGKIDAIMTNSVAYGEIQYVNPTNGYLTVTDIYNKANSINTTKKADYDKLVFVDTIVKGDVIKVTFDFATGVKKTVVEKLDVVTGAITKVVDGVYTIDGVAYENHANGKNLPSKVEKVAKDYFVDGNYIVYSDVISTTKEIPTNIAYVINAKTVAGTDVWGEKTTKKQVEILKNDGTQEVLEYKTYTSGTPEGYANWEKDVKIGSIVEYVMVDGKVYFKALDKEITLSAEKGTVDVSENKLVADKATYLVNEDTYFFVVKADNKFAVVKASELKADIDTVAKSTIVYNENGFKYVTCAVLDDSTTVPSAAVVAIAANQITEELNDKNETIYKLEATKLDGTPVVLMAKNDTVLKTVKGKFMTYKLDANGYIVADDTKVVTVGTADSLKYAEGNAIVLGKGSYMELAKDAKIYYVDAYKSNNENRIIVSEGEGFVLSVETAPNTFADSVLYQTKDGKISQIIMEINGEAISDVFYK